MFVCAGREDAQNFCSWEDCRETRVHPAVGGNSARNVCRGRGDELTSHGRGADAGVVHLCPTAPGASGEDSPRQRYFQGYQCAETVERTRCAVVGRGWFGYDYFAGEHVRSYSGGACDSHPFAQVGNAEPENWLDHGQNEQADAATGW
eukprot:03047_6